MVAQTVKNVPEMQETMVQSLGLQDPLENGMAAHSSILAWEIPWTQEPGGPKPIDGSDLAAAAALLLCQTKGSQ